MFSKLKLSSKSTYESEIKNSAEKRHKLQRKLQAALEYANNICIMGAGNKIEDIERTNGWCLFQNSRYDTAGRYIKLSNGKFSWEKDSSANLKFDSEQRKLVYDKKQWFYHVDDLEQVNSPKIILNNIQENKSPLFDPQFKLPPSHLNLLASAMLAISKRQGNCQYRCDLVAKYLWEHPEGINRIEVIYTSFDHVFVIVNRSGDDIKHSETWGDAWIIDAWYGDKGFIYPASEFKEKIKEIKQFEKDQVKKCGDIGVNLDKFDDHGEDIDKCICEIQPDRDRYPSYSDNPIEDYYILENIYPAKRNPADNMRTILHETQRAHKEKFNACLKEIAAFDEKQRNNFFPSKKIKLIEKLDAVEPQTEHKNEHKSAQRKRKFAEKQEKIDPYDVTKKKQKSF